MRSPALQPSLSVIRRARPSCRGQDRRGVHRRPNSGHRASRGADRAALRALREADGRDRRGLQARAGLRQHYVRLMISYSALHFDEPTCARSRRSTGKLGTPLSPGSSRTSEPDMSARIDLGGGHLDMGCPHQRRALPVRAEPDGCSRRRSHGRRIEQARQTPAPLALPGGRVAQLTSSCRGVVHISGHGTEGI